MLTVTVDQRIVVKFHLKIGKTATENYNLFENVYGNEYLSCILKCFKAFQYDREDAEDDS